MLTKKLIKMIEREDLEAHPDMLDLVDDYGIEYVRNLIESRYGLRLYIPIPNRMESLMRRYIEEEKDRSPRYIAQEINRSIEYVNRILSEIEEAKANERN